tara:strand:+ start:680 stop:829 length:150 start_codon:yes stop_codon:yes gene_type:complete
MIYDAVGISLIMLALSMVTLVVAALITVIDQGLDGLITKKIKKRFGGGE